MAFILVAQVANVALTVRRLHDMGRTGWWALLYHGLPFLMVFFVTGAQEGTLWAVVVYLIVFAVPLAALADLGIRPGTPGPNRFGADPKGRMNISVFD